MSFSLGDRVYLVDAPSKEGRVEAISVSSGDISVRFDNNYVQWCRPEALKPASLVSAMAKKVRG